MKNRKIKIGVVQFNADTTNPGENLETAVNYIELLIEKGADMVVLPEMFNTGYGTDGKILGAAEDVYEETIETLCAVSDYNDIAIIGGIARKAKGKWFNSAAIVRPYQEVVFYDKTHLFRNETDVFTPGDKFVTFEFMNIKFGNLICYEIGFPEVSRSLCKSGAEILIAIFAFGEERKTIYDIATNARALENGSYLVAASQCGSCPSMKLVGNSTIVSPGGLPVAEAGNAEGIIMSTLDLSNVDKYRNTESNSSHGYFKNFREDLYVR